MPQALRPRLGSPSWVAAPLASTEDGPERALLYLGGRNENVIWAPDIASYSPSWHVYAFNYRGLGASSGVATEASVKADLLAIVNLIRRRHSRLAEFAIIGRSLGTAFAIWLALRAMPTRLALLSPFESLPLALARRRWMRVLRQGVAQPPG